MDEKLHREFQKFKQSQSNSLQSHKPHQKSAYKSAVEKHHTLQNAAKGIGIDFSLREKFFSWLYLVFPTVTMILLLCNQVMPNLESGFLKFDVYKKLLFGYSPYVTLTFMLSVICLPDYRDLPRLLINAIILGFAFPICVQMLGLSVWLLTFGSFSRFFCLGVSLLGFDVLFKYLQSRWPFFRYIDL